MIFGIQHSAIKHSSTVYNLTQSVLDPVFYIPDTLESRSILTGKRHYIKKGAFQDFYVLYYPQSAQDIKNIMNIKGERVAFAPHIDNSYIPDVAGNDALFYVSNITLSHLATADRVEFMRIDFHSEGHIIYTPSADGYGFDYAVDYGVGL